MAVPQRDGVFLAPDALLIDLDGVLHVGWVPVPGAIDAIDQLRENGYQFRIISNSTRRSRETISRMLGSLGLGIPVSHIFTPSIAAAAYITGKGGDRATILASPEVIEEMRCEGIQELREGMERARFVVVGDAGDLFTYALLTGAFREILGGAELIALEKDRYWMGNEGLMLSAGPYVSALEYASGKTATLVGKPSRDFFAMALASMNARPGSTLMVGDDVVTDIGGAAANGIPGVLVKTGKFRNDTLENALIRPARVIESIADLPRLLASGDFRSDL